VENLGDPGSPPKYPNRGGEGALKKKDESQDVLKKSPHAGTYIKRSAREAGNLFFIIEIYSGGEEGQLSGRRGDREGRVFLPKVLGSASWGYFDTSAIRKEKIQRAWSYNGGYPENITFII